MTDHGHAPDSLYQRDDRADLALGRAIVLTAAFILAGISIVTTSIWPGTFWPLIPFMPAVALLATVIHKETDQ